jgi:hypothetical protein
MSIKAAPMPTPQINKNALLLTLSPSVQKNEATRRGTARKRVLKFSTTSFHVLDPLDGSGLTAAADPVAGKGFGPEMPQNGGDQPANLSK